MAPHRGLHRSARPSRRRCAKWPLLHGCRHDWCGGRACGARRDYAGCGITSPRRGRRPWRAGTPCTRRAPGSRCGRSIAASAGRHPSVSAIADTRPVATEVCPVMGQTASPRGPGFAVWHGKLLCPIRAHPLCSGAEASHFVGPFGVLTRRAGGWRSYRRGLAAAEQAPDQARRGTQDRAGRGSWPKAARRRGKGRWPPRQWAKKSPRQ
jgi:hypothetical protein